MNTAFLQHCPVCQYSLEGLPTQHRCPECWFDYDKRTEVIRQGMWNLDWYNFREAVLIFGLLVGAVAMIVAPSKFSPRPLGLREAVLILVGIVMWLLRRPGWINRRRKMVLLSFGGMTLVVPGAGTSHVPWKEVARITTSWVTGAVQLISAGDVVLAEVSSNFLSSKRRVQKLLNSARHWKERYDEAAATKRD